MPNNPTTWDDYFSDAASAAGESDIAAATSSIPYAPLMQGATYGLAKNLGWLPSNYAAQRAANPLAYQGLEDFGMIASPALAMLAGPKAAAMAGIKFGLSGVLSPAEAMLTRYAANSLLGAGLGAAGTNVTGGNPITNAKVGAMAGGPLSLAPEALGLIAPTISPKVAQYISDYSKVFGDAPQTLASAKALISSKYNQFVQNAGGIDTLTTLPQGESYPEQSLLARLHSIAGRDYRGAGSTGDDVQAVVGNLLDVARSNKGIIDPASYTRFTQSGGDVAALSRSPHGLGRTAGEDIRNALDDALAMQSSGLAERFNLASKAHDSAMQDYQDASNALTFAQAKHLPTDNVYGTQSANADISSAQQTMDDAQQRVFRAAVEKDAIVERLRGALGHESLGETPDLDAINSARNAAKLLMVAERSGTTGKLSINKLASQAEKFFKDPNAAIASPTDMAQAATAQAIGHSPLGKALSWLPGGVGIGMGEEVARNLLTPFAEHVAANPGMSAAGLGVAIPTAIGLRALLRSPTMAKAAVAKALGEAAPGSVSPIATTAAAVGATGVNGVAGGSPTHTSWDDYFTTP